MSTQTHSTGLAAAAVAPRETSTPIPTTAARREADIPDVTDLGLADAGKRRILWADEHMPVLRRIRERFERERPFAGLRLSACLHVTAETANLMRALQAGGADVRLAASNPLSTQDDVAAALVVHFGVPTFARAGEDTETLYGHLVRALEHEPELVVDDGADMVAAILAVGQERWDLVHPVLAAWGRSLTATAREALAGRILGAMEETTTGIVRLKAMERDGVLPFPVVAVNDAKMKQLFDNRYGTGQSALDAIIAATDLMVAGKTLVVGGYGWCGRGLASRARGLGAKVIVTEIDPVKALEATMDGFDVRPMSDAARIGDVFCTVTGNRDIVTPEHFDLMKDGAYVCNAGHFDVEVDVAGLAKMATGVHRGISQHVDQYTLESGRRIYVLAEGRLVNLVAGSGHPAGVMDMSFAGQALGAEHVAQNRDALATRIIRLPDEIDQWVARLKLETMGVAIDDLTPEQERYQASWSLGTS